MQTQQRHFAWSSQALAGLKGCQGVGVRGVPAPRAHSWADPGAQLHSCCLKAQKIARTQLFPVSFFSFHAKDGEGYEARRLFCFTLIWFEINYT